MINVLFVNIDKCFIQQSWNKYLERLPLSVKEYVLKFQKHNDRLRVLCGKLMLQHALQETGHKNLIESIQLDQYKRPFVSKHFDFNISHSGNYVILAHNFMLPNHNGHKIGIDVERKREVEYEEFKRVFAPIELTTILKSQNPTDQFFEFWTMKEAVMKADGRGFHLPAAGFTVINNKTLIENKTWYLTRIFLDVAYDCHLATENQNPDLKIEALIFP